MRRLLIVLVVGMVMGCSSAAPSALPAEPTKSLAPATTTPTAAVTSTAATTISATACTGTVADRAKFVDTASKAAYPVYCAVLPADWSVKAFATTPLSGGLQVVVEYMSTGGLQLMVVECPCSKEAMHLGGGSPVPSVAGQIGNMPADVYGTGGSFQMVAAPNPALAYQVWNPAGVSREQLMTWTAAFVVVAPGGPAGSMVASAPTPWPTGPFGQLKVSVAKCTIGPHSGLVTITYTGEPSPSNNVLIDTNPDSSGGSVKTFGNSALSTDSHTIITALDWAFAPQGYWVRWDPYLPNDPTVVHITAPKGC